MKKSLSKRYKFISLIIFLITWEIIYKILENSLIFPSIFDIYKALVDIIFQPNFFIIIFRTLFRLFISLIFSTFFSLLLGTLSFKYKVIDILLFPIISFLKAVPTIAIIILVLIWSDIDKVPMIVGFLILFPILYEQIFSGIENTDKKLLKMSNIFKVKKIDIIKNIYIPSIYFSISSTLPSLIGLTFKVIIAGEVLSQESNSIGGEIFLSKVYLESSKIFAWIILIIFINFIIESFINILNRKITTWR